MWNASLPLPYILMWLSCSSSSVRSQFIILSSDKLSKNPNKFSKNSVKFIRNSDKLTKNSHRYLKNSDKFDTNSNKLDKNLIVLLTSADVSLTRDGTGA